MKFRLAHRCARGTWREPADATALIAGDNDKMTSSVISVALRCNGLRNGEAVLAGCLTIYSRPCCAHHTNRIGDGTDAESGAATSWAGVATWPIRVRVRQGSGLVGRGGEKERGEGVGEGRKRALGLR